MEEKIYDKEFLCIKEFAEMVGMTVRALRHYDEKGIFHPAKRGDGIESQYRYFSPTQITMVKMIRVLAEIDVPLQTIKELNQNRTPEIMLKLFAKNKGIIADKIRFWQDAYSVMETFIDVLNEGLMATESELTVYEMPSKQIILGDKTDFSDTVGFVREFTRFCNSTREPFLNTSYPIGGYWDSMEAFLGEPSRPVRFFSLDPKGHEQKAAGLYLVGYTRGYYGTTNDLPERMAAFAKEKGLVFNGPVYNLYLFDEFSTSDPAQYLLQVSASVRESRRSLSRQPYS